MKNLVYLFSHGFGLTPTFWKPLLAHFQKEQVFCIDWSSIEEPKKLSRLLQSRFRAKTHFIGIGHSLGFSKLLHSNVPFKALVGLNAFTHFLGLGKALCQRRTQEHTHFETSFRRNAAQTLAAFYQRGGLPTQETTVPHNILLADLDLLRQKTAIRAPCLIINGTKDRIVPPALTKDNFHHEEHITLHMMHSGQHALGFLEAPKVAQQMKAFFACL
ncbi:MAG: alpha/beta fold hydrolase [Holosporaceae bacterium]